MVLPALPLLRDAASPGEQVAMKREHDLFLGIPY